MFRFRSLFVLAGFDLVGRLGQLLFIYLIVVYCSCCVPSCCSETPFLYFGPVLDLVVIIFCLSLKKVINDY